MIAPIIAELKLTTISPIKKEESDESSSAGKSSKNNAAQTKSFSYFCKLSISFLFILLTDH